MEQSGTDTISALDRAVREYALDHSVDRVTQALSKIQIKTESFETLRHRVEDESRYPANLLELIISFRGVQILRETVNEFYETAMAKYDEITKLTLKQKPSSEINDIRETLTNYILKVESVYEKNDLLDESVATEIQRFLSENVEENLSGRELATIDLNSKAKSLLEPHIKQLMEISHSYQKLHPTLARLIRISNFIIEDYS